MAREVMHIRASRSWWNGNSTTLCGLVIQDARSVRFPSLSSNTKCPSCEALHKAQR